MQVHVHDEEVQKAYENFEKYLISTGLCEKVPPNIKHAFKSGYVAGARNAEVNRQLNFIPKLNVNLTQKEVDELVKLLSKESAKFAPNNTAITTLPKSEKPIHKSEQLEAKLFGKKKHYPNGKGLRSAHQINKDNDTLIYFLKAARKPIELSEIIRYLNRCGSKHWNTNNASAFVRLAKERGLPIKKLARGLYVHTDYYNEMGV